MSAHSVTLLNGEISLSIALTLVEAYALGSMLYESIEMPFWIQNLVNPRNLVLDGSISSHWKGHF